MLELKKQRCCYKEDEYGLKFGATRFRADGKSVSRLGWPGRCPCRCHVESLGIITGRPELRRKFLDWLVFHVEHGFNDSWTNYNHALKQRNAMLKMNRGRNDGADPWVRAVWHGELVTEIRAQVLSLLEEAILQDGSCQRLLSFLMCLKAGALAGVEPDEVTLDQVYKQTLPLDSLRGYTSVGPHRADFGVWVGSILRQTCVLGAA